MALTDKTNRGLCSRTAMPDGRTPDNISWYYNWNPNPKPRGDLLPVPMIWGSRTYPATATQRTIWGAVPLLPADYSGALLWLNEPMEKTQANVTVEEAAAAFWYTRRMWPKARIIGPQLLIGMDGSAGYIDRAKWFLSAFVDRFRALTTREPNLHGLAFHNYISDPKQHLATSREFMRHGRNLFGSDVPFTVSEWGINGTHHPRDGGESAVRTVAQWYDHNVASHAYFMLYGDDEPAFADFMLTKAGQVTGCGRGWGLDW